MRYVGKAPIGLALVYVLWTACGPAAADNFQVTPAISLKQEYMDNILFTADNELDDFITTLSPSVRIHEKTERLDASLNSRLDAVGYADHDTFNAFETSHEGKLSYSITPLISLSTSASYEKDSRADRDIRSSGLVLNSSKRQKQAYSVGGNWIVSEKLQAGVSANFGRSDFEDPTLVDVRYGGFGVGLAVNLEEYFPKTVGNSNFSYTRYNYISAITRNYLWTVGFEHNLTERYTLAASVGPRYTESEFAGNSGDEWGLGGDLSLEVKLDELTDASFALSQEQTDVSGSAGTTERTSLTASVNRRIYGEWTLGLRAEYRKNKSSSSISNLTTDENTYSISPNVTYKITDDLSLQTEYRFTSIDQNGASGTTTSRSRNTVFVQLSYRVNLFD